VRSSDSRHDSMAGTVWRLVAVALTLLITGCASEPPTEPEGSPTGSATPWSGDVRYNPVNATLCESMDLEGILRDVGLTMERPRFNGTPDEPTPGVDEFQLWVATCEFDTEPDDPLYIYSAGVGVAVTEDPRRAYGAYGIEINLIEKDITEEVDSEGASGGITPIDGWWEEGVYAEYEPGGLIVSIVFRVYHENLHMGASFNISYKPAQIEREAVGAFGRGLAEALIDEAIRLVPCEALGGAPPPTHCDDQG